MNTILSTLFIVFAVVVVMSRFLPVKRCSKYKWKTIKRI